MRKYFLIAISLLMCCSCVDEFEADLPVSETNILCIEGTIRSDTRCTFHVSHTVPLDTLVLSQAGLMVIDAQLEVNGSDGQSWPGMMTGPGSYEVNVGSLSPDATYWLEVSWRDNTYTSVAQVPLPTPAIEGLSWDLTSDKQKVNIMVTPQAAGSQEAQFFRWTYDECWEIHTPLISNYEYLPLSDSIAPIQQQLNVGWVSHTGSNPIYGSNRNYGNGQIRNLRIYQADPNDDRFNHRYRTSVTQLAISREEYEYWDLSARLSDEMGGLFTPQPSSLPTNIVCQTADLPVIGFVGVSLNATTAQLYINSKDVNHHDLRAIDILDSETSKRTPWIDLWNRGWRVYEYFPEFDPPVTWVARWCIDCTDPVWGATLVRPDDWED